MKKRRIFSFFFSLLTLLVFAQKKAETPSKKWTYQPNLMIGIDLLNAAQSPFADRQMFKGFVSTQVKGNIHALLEAGYDKNKYEKNGYNAQLNGVFLKAGGFYMLIKDRENPTNGFYIGANLAGSVYQQEYFAIPVRGFGGSNSSVALPKSTQSSYWGEVMLGGRVQLFRSRFYIDLNVQPKFLLYTTKQDDVFPMIVAGFGKSSSKFSTGLSWNIAYSF